METRANYVLIGAFTVLTAVFLLLFALWAAKFSSDRDWDRYERNGHRVTIAADSWLAATLGAGEHAVNSVHHQAIRRVAPSLRCVAVAPDSVVEAVERIDAEQFLVGVQWHPEWQTADDPDDPGAASRGHALFAAFVAAVGARRSP